MENNIEYGSDNIFADLGFKNPEEALRKANLASIINKALSEKGVKNQKKAGELLGISQQEVSNISLGRLRNFSIERLMELLEKLNFDVVIHINKNNRTVYKVA